jgi:thiol-disulfide isomerase/thioredoxin
VSAAFLAVALTGPAGCGRGEPAGPAPSGVAAPGIGPPSTAAPRESTRSAATATAPTGDVGDRTGDGAPPPEVAAPYDEGADAEADLRAALAAAGADGRRVLVVFGANWCAWCRRLEHVLRHEPRVAATLAERFHVVHVDTGARRSGKHAGLAARLGQPTRHGLPVFVVLDATGAVLHTQETGSLERGDRHDPDAVLAFLTRAGGT